MITQALRLVIIMLALCAGLVAMPWVVFRGPTMAAAPTTLPGVAPQCAAEKAHPYAHLGSRHTCTHGAHRHSRAPDHSAGIGHLGSWRQCQARSEYAPIQAGMSAPASAAPACDQEASRGPSGFASTDRQVDLAITTVRRAGAEL